MSRVRARQIGLVNWNGVFYERYELDEHVTALEGVNGAGKTTVMIAAYVVLLPDMTRLRFTNVGEGDATGGDRGIAGRLGDSKRPSYAVVEFELPGGQRLIAGVRLDRKGTHTVELNPFMITDLPADVCLQEVLLLHEDDQDLVPEVQEMQESVTGLGGRMQTFRTAKDYFAALFERGVTPLRLSTDEERTRLNDMLRTSMTGGISRSLTSEFRSFLLKEESGLADTLVRMRGNLDACRRTRTEVQESQELEAEITRVYEAGHAMFAAAMLAMRERADELRKRVDDARKARDQAMRNLDDVASDLSRAREELGGAKEQIERIQARLGEAQQRQRRVEEANAIARRLAGLDAELGEERAELDAAVAAQEQARREYDTRAERLTRAEDAHHRAAEGLADLQKGLEELHRRANAHRTVTRHLQEARRVCGRDDLGVDDVDACRVQLESTLDALDTRRNEIDSRLAMVQAHREEHSAALRALSMIAERTVEASDALAEGRRALATLDGLGLRAGRVDALAEELEQLRIRADLQRGARDRALELSTEEHPLTASQDVHDALSRLEQALDQQGEKARAELAAAEEQRRAQETMAEQHERLQTRLARWRELELVASRLEGTLGDGLRSRASLDQARELLDEQRDELQQRSDSLRAAQTEAVEEARMLEQTGGAFHRDLLMVRDRVGGELLAGHFDDVPIGQAGPLQARLGPIGEAIVVDNAHAAAAVLRGTKRSLDTVRLVEGSFVQQFDEPGEIEAAADDVVVEEGGIVRVTRVPAKPTLGRRARRRRIEELKVHSEALAIEFAAHEGEFGELESRRRDTALLLSECSVVEGGDPSSELQSLDARLARARKAERRHRVAAEKAREQLATLRRGAAHVRELQPRAHLLDEPDLELRVEALTRDCQEAIGARAEVERTKEARRTLSERLDALRRPPLSDEGAQALLEQLEALGVERRDKYLGVDALRYVAMHREALGWSDAEPALAAKRGLVPELERQYEKAERERDGARRQAELGRAALDEARSARQTIDGRYRAIEAKRQRERADLEATGIDDASDHALARAVSKTVALQAERNVVDGRERQLIEDVARLQERLRQRKSALEDADTQLTNLEREWKPSQELWERLRAKAGSDGLLTPAITARLREEPIGSPNRHTQARTEGGRLEERLKAAKGGEKIIELVRSWLSGQEQSVGEGYLQAWSVVRDWLRRRVPAQIAEVDDPLEALERLRHHLAALEQRLERQESDLRGASEDVARGIDVHIRRAQGQVRQLNHDLRGVRFGTIQGMIIRLQRDERMENVLRALKDGPEQGMLFDTSIPIEQALDELFRRHGGGRTGGQKLLDYREYVQLAVHIQRQGSAEWERVSPSRLSTGEAIGVGAALMMVVLTAWERTANLFRAKRSVGTLRLLFLDEANRLSHDNLEVLFDLCSSLDLQLLIAAPEVARAKGCTTYRLVRRTTYDGSQEVLVTGRRAIEEPADVGA